MRNIDELNWKTKFKLKTTTITQVTFTSNFYQLWRRREAKPLAPNHIAGE